MTNRNNRLPGFVVRPGQHQFHPGSIFCAKTSHILTDFMENGIHQNAIRTNAIEWILNTTSNLEECLAKLNTTGKIMMTAPVNQQLTKINIADLPPGVYILELMKHPGFCGRFIKR